MIGGEVRSRALMHRLGDKNLAGAGGGLRARRGVNDGADRGEVAMRAAEFTEAELAGMDTDTDAELRAGNAEFGGQGVAPFGPALLDIAGRKHRAAGMSSDVVSACSALISCAASLSGEPSEPA